MVQSSIAESGQIAEQAAPGVSSRAVMVHFHRSDDRFCGSEQQCRRFALNDAEVTCPACRHRTVAMVSCQGTACDETVLTGAEDTPDNRANIERQFCDGSFDAPIPGSWRDCSENAALASAREVQP